MSSVAVQGFYNDLAAFILVDPQRPFSCVSSLYISSHNLPRTVTRDPRSMVATVTCSATISLSSSSGFYCTLQTLVVSTSLATWDIVLGLDWCMASGARVQGAVVLDPPPNHHSPPDYTWLRADAVGLSTTVLPTSLTPPLFFFASQSVSSLSGGGPAPTLLDQCSSNASSSSFTANARGLPGSTNLHTSGPSSSGLFDAGLSCTTSRASGSCESLTTAHSCASVASSSRPGSASSPAPNLSTASSGVPSDATLPSVPAVSSCASCEALRSLRVGVRCSSCSFLSAAPHQSSLQELLSMSGFERLSNQQLISRLHAHGVLFGVDADSDDLRNLYLVHVLNGHCWQQSGAACVQISSFIVPDGSDDAARLRSARLQLLNALPRRMSLKPLRRVLSALDVQYDVGSSVGQLRRLFSRFVNTFVNGSKKPSAGCLPTTGRPRCARRAAERDAVVSHYHNVAASWPQPVPPQLKDKLLANFRHQTSSSTLAVFTCGCCAAACPVLTKCVVALDDLPLDLLRSPSISLPPIPGIENSEHLLLDRSAILASREVELCNSCWSSLRKDSLPKTAGLCLSEWFVSRSCASGALCSHTN
ncbi:hypothetical protein BC629DRAFT_73115 [Irpex lacteus]|nr:hypothetical protein BC629DRAFT_73115 [Irpex lacteus]